MDSKQKAAHIRYTEARMRVRATYDPGFVAALKAGLVERKWDERTKEWVIDIHEYKTARRIISRFYQNITESNRPPEERKKKQRRQSSPKTSYMGLPHDADYAVLHLLPTAPLELVKVAYRTLSKLYHPDTSKFPDAEKRMKAINRAYEAIKKRQG